MFNRSDVLHGPVSPGRNGGAYGQMPARQQLPGHAVPLDRQVRHGLMSVNVNNRSDVWPGYHGQHIDYTVVGTEHVPTRSAESAVNGEFIDLIDFVNSSISVSETDEFKTFIDECGNVNFKYQRNKKAITSAFRWLEAWGSYQLIVCRMYSYNVLHHMISYQIFILSLFAKYKLPYVITYDIRHRQILGRRRSFEFSRLNQELFVTTFDANAIRSVNRCTKCSAVDHATGDCPFRGTGQTANLPRAKNSDQSSEICLLFQQGLCKPSRKCRRKHVCMGCGGKEGFRDCAKCSKSKN
jgi:hypothetical protein